jgi:hypothetical protein
MQEQMRDAEKILDVKFGDKKQLGDLESDGRYTETDFKNRVWTGFIW